MSRTLSIDLEDCWKLLGREMSRECSRINHHFRCRAGEARFTWIIKRTMIASTNEYPRLVITKGAVKVMKVAFADFAIRFYADENAPPEHYTLTIDEHMTCSLGELERRVSVREMCQRFFGVLCISSPDRKLLELAFYQ